eukprot:TRINITY_DN8485_c0_g1_i1.p1 TRINITY_DN8485_c0_g1~~TRINITY_DN8485_c0_g1_i1.p1  ORF type:complete len:258 (+),score=63.10 TRINITY_DN8485_c0_g1_i1:66-776(+)
MDYFKKLCHHLPDHIQALPLHQQKEFMMYLLRRRRDENVSMRLYQEYKDIVKADYQHLHPSLLDLSTWLINGNLIKAIDEDDEDAVREVLTEVHPGIFEFPMLKEETCNLILEEVENFEAWNIAKGLKIHRPNSMNNYGAILDDFGFEDVLNELMNTIIDPLRKILYSHMKKLDSHHGFIVSYAIGKDTKLDFHVDTAEVTLNLCLGKEFTGGDLYFGGVRCSNHTNTPPHQGIYL